jgi:hypothetical protein
MYRDVMDEAEEIVSEAVVRAIRLKEKHSLPDSVLQIARIVISAYSNQDLSGDLRDALAKTEPRPRPKTSPVRLRALK